MNSSANEVNDYFKNLKFWKEEALLLRSIIQKFDLIEEWKWKSPCYTLNDSNVLILGAYKKFFAMSFFKGVLLKDPSKSLVFAGENSKIAKLIKFETLDQIQSKVKIIEDLIIDAISIENKGLKVKSKSDNEMSLPIEIQDKMMADETFNLAFNKLSKGRQRGYAIFVNGAKQSSTRIKRIEKYYNRILDGKGINDCVCGHSKRMPNCDGSHKKYK